FDSQIAAFATAARMAWLLLSTNRPPYVLRNCWFEVRMRFPQLRGTCCRLNDASGFTLVQITITVAIIAIVSTFAIIGLSSARASLRLQNSVRQLSAYLE